MKQKISVTIEEKTLELIDEIVKTGIFRNKSHAVEFGLNRVLKENQTQDEKQGDDENPKEVKNNG